MALASQPQGSTTLSKALTRKRTARVGPPSKRLRDLKVSSAFRDFVLDHLADVPNLRAKAMFGAHEGK